MVRWAFRTLLTFLISFCTIVSSYPDELKIGLLSHKGLGNVDTAFTYAIDTINKDMSILSQTKLIPEIVEMESAEDSPSYVIRNTVELVNKEVSAVIGPFRSSQTQIASYILSALHIPIISPTSTDPFLRNPHWSDYLLHMQPLDDYQSYALLDLVKHMKWSSVALISSMDSYGINGLTTFQKYSNERNIKIVANEMIPLVLDLKHIDVSKQVLNLKHSEARIFIMNVHSGYARPILKAAKEMDLIGPDYAWIVTDGTIKDAENLINGTDKKFDDYTQGMIGFMSSVCCSSLKQEFIDKWEEDTGGVPGNVEIWGLNNSTTTSLRLQSRASLTYDSVWVVARALQKLIYDDHQDLKPPSTVDFWSTPVLYYGEGQKLLSYMLKMNFEGLTGQISFDHDGGPIKKTYDLVNFRVRDVVKVGEWKPNIGLKMNTSEIILWNGQERLQPSSTIRSLKGRTLRLGITREPPFIHINEECKIANAAANKSNLECYSGLCIELIDKLSQQLGFDYIYIESEDGKFGAPLPNGKGWNGLIKMLLDGKLDVGAVNFAMNKARESAIDFSMPFINTGLVMTTKIKESKSDAFFWTKPFDVDLWYAILAFAVLMVLLIWLYDHMSPFGYYGRRMHAALRCSCKPCERFRSNKEQSMEDDEEETCLFETRLCDPSENKEELMNVGNSLWMVAACLFSIGPVEGVPRNMSGRIILAMWWFMILIVTAMYTANLAAFLTVTRMEGGINSISDLINQDTVKWGTVNGTNAEILLKFAKSPELEMVYKDMERVNSIKEGFRRARDDDYIFFYGGAIVTFEANTKPCNLHIIGEQLFSFGYAFGFPPHSPYMETFNAALLNLSEQNELDSLWKKWSKGDCVSKGKSAKSSSLNLANIYGLCYTFFVVIAVSAIILLGEILYESIMDMKRFKTSFISAIKYRFIYIWKRPEYQNSKYQVSQDMPDEESKKSEEMNVKELIQMVEFDNRAPPPPPKPNADAIIPYTRVFDKESKKSIDLRYPSPDPEKIVLMAGNGYGDRPNGYPIPAIRPTAEKYPRTDVNANVAYMAKDPHPYHNSLPLEFSPAGSDASKDFTGKLYPSIHRSQHKQRPKHPSRTQSARMDNPQNFEELFDRTLERMTNTADSRSDRSGKAKRVNPSNKGASLSTRSSLIYSSPEVSDTDELRSESDISLPP